MTDFDLDGMLKRLHLANARRVWRELAERAEKEQWTYDHLLRILFAEEIAHRAQTRLNRLSHAAKFPFFKTIDDYDFTFQSTLRMSMFGTFLSPDFVSEGGCLVLSGKPGRGKTHLAVAVAYRAIQNGFDALFTTAAALIDDLSVAARDGTMRQALARYVQPSVLVIDELGYLTYGRDAANVIFHVVNERHLKKRAMVVTTNKTLKAWGDVLHDPDLAEAIVDRLLERGRVVQLDGPSIRSKHLDPAALDGGKEPAIISGTDLPDFPEPTGGSPAPMTPSSTSFRTCRSGTPTSAATSADESAKAIMSP